MTNPYYLEPLNGEPLARFMAIVQEKDRLHTFHGQAGCDMPADYIHEYARQRGAWLTERGSFADTLNHHVAVMDDIGNLLSVEVSRETIGVTDTHIEAFHFDEANSDEEYAYIDVLGGATVAIKRGDDGVSVEIFPAQVSDRPVAETWATWAEITPDEQEAIA